jgi:hypothetical protein
METNTILDGILAGNAHVESLRTQVIQAKKMQLHSGVEGFESPESYGVYRHTGGAPLGVVGSVFQPMDLNVFIDSIEQSVANCGNGLDISKLQYDEFKGGSKVAFSLPVKSYKLKTPQVGDIVETKLMFSTGFDGLTKCSLSYMTKRLWCTNGAAAWDKKTSFELSFKNTIGNQFKVMMFCDEVMNSINNIEAYIKQLNELNEFKVTKEQQDRFVTKLTGFNMGEYKDLNTNKRNILDRINRDILIESNNTGMTAFSLLQGITRYTTHELGKGDVNAVLFDNAAKLNQKAHELVLVESSSWN